MSPIRLALLLQSAEHNRLHTAVSLVATAVAQGGEAHLLLTHAALHTFLEGRWDTQPCHFGDPTYDQLYADAVDAERIPSLLDLLAQARARGNVRVYGCQTSIILHRGYPPEALEQLDAVIGHSTFMTLARDMQWLVL